MDFSVLLSVYGKDDALFFQRALESVTIDQTVKPTEVIVVEDGPVGEEIEQAIYSVSSRCPKIEFNIIRKKQNFGLAAALNTGLKEAKYEWVARMDSDDISLPNRFEKQINYLREHPGVECLGGAISEFNVVPGDMLSERHTCTDAKGIIRMSKTRTPMNHVSVMYKKNAVIQAGMYSEDFGKLEDYKLWVDMIGNNIELANIDDVIVYVRVGNGFIERRSNKREIIDWDMLQNYLLKNNIVTKFEAIKNRVYIRVFIYMPVCLKKIAYKAFLRK